MKTAKEIEKEFYLALREKFSCTTDPYEDIAGFALTEFIASYIIEYASQQQPSREKKLSKGCVVYMNAGSGCIGHGNVQCVSWVSHEIGELSLYGHNQNYKTHEVREVVEYPLMESELSEGEEEVRTFVDISPSTDKRVCSNCESFSRWGVFTGICNLAIQNDKDNEDVDENHCCAGFEYNKQPQPQQLDNSLRELEKILNDYLTDDEIKEIEDALKALKGNRHISNSETSETN